jgi:hypothetical protein
LIATCRFRFVSVARYVERLARFHREAEEGDAFVADKPRAWSEKQIGGACGTKNVDLAPDGERIVALRPVETAEGQKAQSPVIFLQPWGFRERTSTIEANSFAQMPR